MVAIKEKISRDPALVPKFTEWGGLVWKRGRLVLPSTSQYKSKIIREYHDTPIGGHSGMIRIYHRVNANFN